MKKVLRFGTISKILLIAVLVIIQLTAGLFTASAASKDDIKASGSKFYLPPENDATAAVFNIDADAYSVEGGEKILYTKGEPIDISGGEVLDRYGNKCYRVYFYKGGSSTMYNVYILSDIPTVYIETSAGIKYVHSSKENRDSGATVLISDENGNTVYSDEDLETFSELKLRGNATAKYEKKPYQLKLGKKTDLFGMGKAKTWILLANYVDQSFLRNAIAFDIADTLGLDYSPKSVFVNLYIDGQFYGLYQLAEKTQIGSNRIEIFDLEEATEDANKGVDIDAIGSRTEYIGSGNLSSIKYVPGVKNPEDITGGYLIELDNLYGFREASSFTTAKNNTYVIKSPEFASREQVMYIATLFAEMEEAIYSSTGYNSKGKHFSEYADIDSLIQMYMTYEITKNWDAYVGSTFFYKDKDEDGVTSKIYAGPAWDFDHSFGNLDHMTFRTDKTELWAAGTKRSDYCRFFGYYLIKHRECADLLAKYAGAATDRIYEMLADGGYIDEMTALLNDSVSADRAVWGYQRGGGFESFEHYTGYGLNSAIGFLTDFMKERADGIYKYFVGTNYVPHDPEETTESTTEATTEATTETTEATTFEITTATASEATTETATTTEETTATTESTTEATTESGGCKSTVGTALGVCAAAMAIGLFAVKKKKE